MSTSRTNSPLKTLFLLAVIGGIGWFAYEYLYVRRILSSADATEPLDKDRKDKIRQTVLDQYSTDPCFVEIGPLYFRVRDGGYRIDLTASDGCGDVKRLCERISETIADDFDVRAQVFAYDAAGRQLARHIP